MKKTTKFFIFALCVSSIPALIQNTSDVNAENDTVIEAFAHYEFNDASNPGKDSSMHGFDLVKQVTSANQDAMQVLKDGDDSYVSIRRDQYATGVTKDTGAYLYAPQQGNTSYDFSDMINGSYTFSATFKSDNSIGHGDVYAISFGRYNSCFTIVPWANKLQIQVNSFDYAEGTTDEEKQQFCETNVLNYTISTIDWTNVTVSADADTKKCRIFINGNLMEEVTLPGVRLTTSHDDYTFAIGAQCNIYGNSATQYGNVDVKNLQLYDCALSDANVAKLISGEQPTLNLQGEGTVYVESISEVDLTTIDAQITDVNTIDNLLTNGLPNKLKAKTSNNIERSYPVYWYKTNNSTIKGYLQTGVINPQLKEVEIPYNYTCKFAYDEDIISLKEVKLDGKDFTPGTAIDSKKHLITFKIDAKNGAKVNSVEYYGMEWDAEDDGTYYIDIAEGALITIDASLPKYKITYMDGDEKLGTSTYTENGNEKLSTFTKEGYTFVGWYADKELTKEYSAIDYANPTDLTLYAKWEEVKNNDDNNNTSKGCKGDVAFSFMGLVSIAGALIISKKRK